MGLSLGFRNKIDLVLESVFEVVCCSTSESGFVSFDS